MDMTLWWLQRLRMAPKPFKPMTGSQNHVIRCRTIVNVAIAKNEGNSSKFDAHALSASCVSPPHFLCSTLIKPAFSTPVEISTSNSQNPWKNNVFLKKIVEIQMINKVTWNGNCQQELIKIVAFSRKIWVNIKVEFNRYVAILSFYQTKIFGNFFWYLFLFSIKLV